MPGPPHQAGQAPSEDPMPYFTRAQIEAELPAQFLTQALDDNGDGTEDTGKYDEVAAAACGDADALVSQKYPVPFSTPYPPLIAMAARMFMLEKLYSRRGYTGENNPHAGAAEKMRSRLIAVGSGTAALGPEVAKAAPAPVRVITEPSGLHSEHNRVFM